MNNTPSEQELRDAIRKGSDNYWNHALAQDVAFEKWQKSKSENIEDCPSILKGSIVDYILTEVLQARAARDHSVQLAEALRDAKLHADADVEVLNSKLDGTPERFKKQRDDILHGLRARGDLAAKIAAVLAAYDAANGGEGKPSPQPQNLEGILHDALVAFNLADHQSNVDIGRLAAILAKTIKKALA